MLKNLFLILSVAPLLGGCQTQFASDFDRLSPGMQAERITTDRHQHLVLYQMAENSTDALHVYIEGDGLPWLRRYFVARDPTPRHVLALQLMQRDTASDTLYLGRPCYFNSARYGLADEACHPSLWTSRRYSEEVVASMADALRQAVDLSRYQRVVLIGHSGGGTLAALIGHRMQDEVDLVVTIAANLDTEAWTRHHRFSPLFGSLNPAEETLGSRVRQIHWAGGKDDIVPPHLHSALAEAPGHSLRVVPEFGHSCCWLDRWPKLLYSEIY